MIDLDNLSNDDKKILCSYFVRGLTAMSMSVHEEFNIPLEDMNSSYLRLKEEMEYLLDLELEIE